MMDPEIDQDGNGHSDGQAHNIDDGKAFLL
jgi:hypothetical protein